MPCEGISEQAVLGELQRVLASDGFARNQRLSRFLQVVVMRHLAGEGCELKESVLGVEVFGRTAGYDPKRDPVVRTEAARLRARLGAYYAGAGKDAAILIGLPKGGYVPELRRGAPLAAAVREAGRQLPSRRFWFCAILAFAIIAVCFTGWRLATGGNEPIRIAVLPFKNLSEDPGNENFVDGLTGEIIRDLSGVDGLTVRSQTSSFALKGKRPSVREAGAQLAAEYILDGTAVRAGRRLRINVQLIRVREDVPVWSEKYDRELTDVLATQEEISQRIVNSLRWRLERGGRL